MCSLGFIKASFLFKEIILNRNTMVKIERIDAIKKILTLGEAPHWDMATQALYFVDIIECTIHKYIPATNQHFQAAIGRSHISAIIPIRGQSNKFIAVSGVSIGIITWDGRTPIISNFEELSEIDIQENTANDAKCDACGRLWTGTMRASVLKGDVENSPKGSLYSFAKKNILRKHYEPIAIANGIAWSKDNKYMYYIDTQQGIILKFDFDLATGTVANPTILLSTKNTNIIGLLDGMTIDNNGDLWVAVYGGGVIIKVDPNKTNSIKQTVEVPFKNPTSVMFGGKNLDELFVTSTTVIFIKGNSVTENDGHLFKITDLGVKGMEANEYQLI